ncbi:MAG: HPr family phosphocarrier protein [Chlamydiales bacterium]
MKIVRKIKVKNSLGLHTRPAASIVKLLQPRQSSVHFTHKNETINARSIMSILMLAAKKNSVIEVTIEGDDAELTMQHLVDAFDMEFGEK